MVKVYGDILSGNCYKIKLLLQFLEIEHDWIYVDIMNGVTDSVEFMRMNPNAKIPVVKLDDGRFLWESNAILNYLAEGSALLPADRYLRAQVLQWQFFEQYSHEPYIATARYIKKYLGLPKEREAEFYAKQAGGHRALKVMDDHLSQHRYFVDDTLSIADIALYAYTHVAEDAEFDLQPYRHIRRWFANIESTPGYVAMV